MGAVETRWALDMPGLPATRSTSKGGAEMNRMHREIPWGIGLAAVLLTVLLVCVVCWLSGWQSRSWGNEPEQRIEADRQRMERLFGQPEGR